MKTVGWVVLNSNYPDLYGKLYIAVLAHNGNYTNLGRYARVFLTKEGAREYAQLDERVMRRTRRPKGQATKSSKVRTVGWRIRFKDCGYKSYMRTASTTFWVENIKKSTLFKTRFEAFAQKYRPQYSAQDDIKVVRITRRRKACAR